MGDGLDQVQLDEMTAAMTEEYEEDASADYKKFIGRSYWCL